MTVADLLIRYRTVVILLLLIAVFTILKNVFILPANLLNMLKRMSFVAITAFGMTFVITLGGLDLSVGGTAAIVGVGFALMLGAGIPAIVALLLCFLIAVALGAVNGVIIVKGRIEPFLVTLATMNIFRGVALMATGGRPVPDRQREVHHLSSATASSSGSSPFPFSSRRSSSPSRCSCTRRPSSASSSGQSAGTSRRRGWRESTSSRSSS